jgi:hypothetical protein
MNTTPETASERLSIKDVVALGLKEHNDFCYEDGNDYTVRWDADGAYLSGPGHEDSAHRLDRDNAFRVLRQRFPESIKEGLIKNLPAAIEGILNATAAESAFKGKIVMPTSLEEMDEASAANARKMWDESTPASSRVGYASTTLAPAYVPTIKDCYDAGLRRVQNTPTYAPEEQHPYPQWAVQFDDNGKNPFMRGGPNDGEALAFTSHDACLLFLQSYGRAE